MSLDALPYIEQLVVFICVFTLLGSSLNLIMGYGGLFSISQAAFFGVGAYVTALAETRLHLGFAPAFLFAILFTAAVGALTSFPAIRLRGDYLIVSSLAAQIIGYTLFVNLDSLTNGPAGIRRIPIPAIGRWTFDSSHSYMIFSLALLAAVFFLMRMWIRSPWGRLLTAVRDDDVAAMSLGKNVVAVKVTAFATAAGIAALAGGLYADFVSYINPDSFTLDRSVVILAVMIIGGMGSLYGSWVGAAIVVALPEALRFLPLPPSVQASLQQLTYGLLLTAFMMFRPQGILVGAPRLRLFAGTAPPERLEARPAAILAGVTGSTPPLSILNVTKRFGGIVALSGVSFDVPRGRVLGIIGPNGAGKTTLLDVVTGFVRPEEGQVCVEGRPVTGRPAYWIARRGVVRVFQEARVFPQMTLRQNVMAGFGAQTRESFLRVPDLRPAVLRHERGLNEEATRLLGHVGLAEKADHPAGALSYGQQKLVCLARALAADPSVLLLDEPCVGLALPMIGQLEIFVRSAVAAGRTVVVVEHNLEFIRAVADRVIFMHEGRVETEGDPDAVLGDERLGRVYFGLSA